MPLSTFLMMQGCSTTDMARDGMGSHGAVCFSSAPTETCVAMVTGMETVASSLGALQFSILGQQELGEQGCWTLFLVRGIRQELQVSRGEIQPGAVGSA